MTCLDIRASFAVRRKARESSAWNTRYNDAIVRCWNGELMFVFLTQNHMPVLPNVQAELQEAYRKSLPHNNKK
jgi:hypothetical protein